MLTIVGQRSVGQQSYEGVCKTTPAEQQQYRAKCRLQGTLLLSSQRKCLHRVCTLIKQVSFWIKQAQQLHKAGQQCRPRAGGRRAVRVSPHLLLWRLLP